MNRLRVILFVLLGLYLLVRWGPRVGASSSGVAWYGADLLCLPLVLGLILVVQRRLLKAEDWLLPRAHGLLAVAAYATYFELVLPHFRPASVGDPWDAVSYLVGWVFFEVFLNRPTRTRVAGTGTTGANASWPGPSRPPLRSPGD